MFLDDFSFLRSLLLLDVVVAVDDDVVGSVRSLFLSFFLCLCFRSESFSGFFSIGAAAASGLLVVAVVDSAAAGAKTSTVLSGMACSTFESAAAGLGGFSFTEAAPVGVASFGVLLPSFFDDLSDNLLDGRCCGSNDLCSLRSAAAAEPPRSAALLLDERSFSFLSFLDFFELLPGRGCSPDDGGTDVVAAAAAAVDEAAAKLAADRNDDDESSLPAAAAALIDDDDDGIDDFMIGLLEDVCCFGLRFGLAAGGRFVLSLLRSRSLDCFSFFFSSRRSCFSSFLPPPPPPLSLTSFIGLCLFFSFFSLSDDFSPLPPPLRPLLLLFSGFVLPPLVECLLLPFPPPPPLLKLFGDVLLFGSGETLVFVEPVAVTPPPPELLPNSDANFDSSDLLLYFLSDDAVVVVVVEPPSFGLLMSCVRSSIDSRLFSSLCEPPLGRSLTTG